jgi:hypothetical protein
MKAKTDYKPDGHIKQLNDTIATLESLARDLPRNTADIDAAIEVVHRAFAYAIVSATRPERPAKPQSKARGVFIPGRPHEETEAGL